MQSNAKNAFFAVAALAFSGAVSTSAFAVTTHRHARRAVPPADVTQTLVNPEQQFFPPGVGPYYRGQGNDDAAFDSPWNPNFGRGRQLDDSSGAGQGGA